jgi:hypothetical protein
VGISPPLGSMLRYPACRSSDPHELKRDRIGDLPINDAIPWLPEVGRVVLLPGKLKCYSPSCSPAVCPIPDEKKTFVLLDGMPQPPDLLTRGYMRFGESEQTYAALILRSAFATAPSMKSLAVT